MSRQTLGNLIDPAEPCATRTYTHSREDVASFMTGAGLELAEPGVVAAYAWRPDKLESGPAASGPLHVFAAVGTVVSRPAG